VSQPEPELPDVPDVPDPDPAEEVPPRHPVLAVFLTVVGGLLIVMTAATIYGLVRDAGTPSSGFANVLVWSVLPGVVLAIGLRLTFETYARRRVSWWLLILPAYAVAVIVLGAGALLGAAA
jgi:hypothetical protein